MSAVEAGTALLNTVDLPRAHRAAPEAPAADPLAPLHTLLDPGSMETFLSAVRPPGPGIDGDGVVAALGTVDGRPVAAYVQDPAHLGGSLGATGADTLVRLLQTAGYARLPVIGFVASAGARLHEGARALAGYGRVFRELVALEGVVPRITVVTGAAAGGGAYAPALGDLLVMTRDACMFLTGPQVVRQAVGQEVTAEQLGGPRVHGANGVCDMVVDDVPAAAAAVRDLLGHLPGADRDRVPGAHEGPPLPVDLAAVVPMEARRAYDVRDVIAGVVDGGRYLELAPRFARNVVTALARLNGRPVGVVANQPRHLGGTLDSPAARKAARFVELCDRFGLPLVVLVDTSGFVPGTQQEQAGIIRHGAGLIRAFARARVPKVTVVLRKAYGGAYITMNAKDLGAHMTFAWPGAQIGVMAASSAVSILHRRALAAHPDPAGEAERLAADYAAGALGAGAAAADGVVDEVIAPDQTRARLLWALSVLDRREVRPCR